VICTALAQSSVFGRPIWRIGSRADLIPTASLFPAIYAYLPSHWLLIWLTMCLRAMQKAGEDLCQFLPAALGQRDWFPFSPWSADEPSSYGVHCLRLVLQPPIAVRSPRTFGNLPHLPGWLG